MRGTAGRIVVQTGGGTMGTSDRRLGPSGGRSRTGLRHLRVRTDIRNLVMHETIGSRVMMYPIRTIESGVDGTGKPFVKWNGLELPNGTVVVDTAPDANGSWEPVSGNTTHSAGVITWTADDPSTADWESNRVRIQE